MHGVGYKSKFGNHTTPHEWICYKSLGWMSVRVKRVWTHLPWKSGAIDFVASLLHVCGNLSRSLEQAVRTQPDISLLDQSYSKSAAGLSQFVRLYVCLYRSLQVEF
jgi:hypothetical protein